jgi:hypothetical protein
MRQCVLYVALWPTTIGQRHYRPDALGCNLSLGSGLESGGRAEITARGTNDWTLSERHSHGKRRFLHGLKHGLDDVGMPMANMSNV